MHTDKMSINFKTSTVVQNNVLRAMITAWDISKKTSPSNETVIFTNGGPKCVTSGKNLMMGTFPGQLQQQENWLWTEFITWEAGRPTKDNARWCVWCVDWEDKDQETRFRDSEGHIEAWLQGTVIFQIWTSLWKCHRSSQEDFGAQRAWLLSHMVLNYNPSTATLLAKWPWASS